MSRNSEGENDEESSDSSSSYCEDQDVIASDSDQPILPSNPKTKTKKPNLPIELTQNDILDAIEKVYRLLQHYNIQIEFNLIYEQVIKACNSPNSPNCTCRQRRICFHCCLKKNADKYECHKFVTEWKPKGKKRRYIKTQIRNDHNCTGIGSHTIYDLRASDKCLAGKSDLLGPQYHPNNVCSGEKHVGCCITFPTDDVEALLEYLSRQIHCTNCNIQSENFNSSLYKYLNDKYNISQPQKTQLTNLLPFSVTQSDIHSKRNRNNDNNSDNSLPASKRHKSDNSLYEQSDILSPSLILSSTDSIHISPLRHVLPFVSSNSITQSTSKKPSGITNISVACYINAILQSHACVQPFRIGYENEYQTFPSDSLSYNIGKFFALLSIAKQSGQRAVSNKNIVNCLNNKYSANWANNSNDAWNFYVNKIREVLILEGVQWENEERGTRKFNWKNLFNIECDGVIKKVEDVEAAVLLSDWSLDQYAPTLIDWGYSNVEEWRDLRLNDLIEMQFEHVHAQAFMIKMRDYFDPSLKEFKSILNATDTDIRPCFDID
eukprot:72575_1